VSGWFSHCFSYLGIFILVFPIIVCKFFFGGIVELLGSDWCDVVDELVRHGFGSSHWLAGFVSACVSFGVDSQVVLDFVVDCEPFKGPSWSVVQRFLDGRGSLSVVERRSVRDGRIDLESLAVDLNVIHDKLVSKLDIAMDGPLDPGSIAKLSAGINALNRNVEQIDRLVNKDRETRSKLPVNVNIVQLQESLESLVKPGDVPELRRLLMRKSGDTIVEVDGEVKVEED